MRVMMIVALAACTHAAPVATPVTCPPPPAAAALAVPVAAPPTSPAVAAPLDDATVIEKSESFLATFDRADAAAFEAAVMPSFVAFAFGRTTSATSISSSLAGRTSANAATRARTCKDQRVKSGAVMAVYSAVCTIRVSAREDMPAHESDSFNTVILVPVESSWKVGYWSWQTAGLEAEKEGWNEVFRTGVHFKLEPNQLLVDTLKGRKPGTAIDIAMGQGRNALYIASQGWKTTGVDISDEGIKVAQSNAAKRKLKLDAVLADVNKYDFGKAKWDLVTMLYAGNNTALIERVKPSIKKDGLFVVEFFHKEATAGTGIGGFVTDELSKLFSGPQWTIIKDEVVEDIADWGLRKTKLVRFVVRRVK